MVVGHSHADVAQTGDARLEKFEGRADGAEVGADAVGVVGVGGHAHDAGYLRGPQSGQKLGRYLGVELFGSETELCIFGGHVNLKEHPQAAAEARGSVVDTAQQPDGVDTLDNVGSLDNAADLIALEMADEVPFDVVGTGGALGRQLIVLLPAAYLLSLTASAGWNFDTATSRTPSGSSDVTRLRLSATGIYSGFLSPSLTP